MIDLGLTMGLILMTANVSAHEAAIQHEGRPYQLSYRPVVQTEMKTIGMSVGTRMSSERCRIAIRVEVERSIQGAEGNGTLTRRLPGERVLNADRPGSCRQQADAVAAIEAGKADTIRAHVAEVAQADRAQALAEIGAARTLASN
jgi:hypothetical protein